MGTSVVLNINAEGVATNLVVWPAPTHNREADISSLFGTRGSGNHWGVDVRTPSGTQIYSIKEGYIRHRGDWGGGGQTIRVAHDNGYQSLYMHLLQNGFRVGMNERVDTGDLIALSGNTGQSTGPHLHLEVWNDISGQVSSTRARYAINPLEWWHPNDVRSSEINPDPIFKLNTDGIFEYNPQFSWVRP